jgi:hypothetical protein
MHHPDNNSSITLKPSGVGRWLLAVPFCVALGWMLAEVDRDTVASAKQLLAETYLNKFNAMSGADVDEYVYYVLGDAEPLRTLVATTAALNRLEPTEFPTLFNVYIAASERREMLSVLRELPSVSAVFTVPFMCH